MDDEGYDSPTSRDETLDFTKRKKRVKKKKRKRERPKRKKERPKKKKKKIKNKKYERKREKGQCYYLFFHTCASK